MNHCIADLCTVLEACHLQIYRTVVKRFTHSIVHQEYCTLPWRCTTARRKRESSFRLQFPSTFDTKGSEARRRDNFLICVNVAHHRQILLFFRVDAACNPYRHFRLPLNITFICSRYSLSLNLASKIPYPALYLLRNCKTTLT